jgi:transcriptional regulator with XRE-family HTH domain
MAIRRRRADLGTARARELVATTSREFRANRANAGLAQVAVATAAGLSQSEYGRIERGVSPDVSLRSVCRIASALGLEASLRFYPIADPVRDAAQLSLVSRLRERCHRSLTFQTEVPFSRPGDLRAWDAVVSGAGPTGRWRCAVEAETRPTDIQALDRKLALKERDGGADRLILLLSNTRHNRAFVHGPFDSLRGRFPLDGRRALELLAAGVDPGGNAVILL